MQPRVRLGPSRRSPAAALRRFEAGEHAHGPPGVAAYLSALARTGELAQLASGPPEAGALPRLLASLRERLRGSRSLPLGARPTSPLHVVMVDPREARPWPLRLAADAAAALLAVAALSLLWAGGAAAMRRAAAQPGVAREPTALSGALPGAGPSQGLGGAFAPKEYIKARERRAAQLGAQSRWLLTRPLYIIFSSPRRTCPSAVPRRSQTCWAATRPRRSWWRRARAFGS